MRILIGSRLAHSPLLLGQRLPSPKGSALSIPVLDISSKRAAFDTDQPRLPSNQVGFPPCRQRSAEKLSLAYIKPRRTLEDGMT